MARERASRYQYETSPRKLEPEYDAPKPQYKKKSSSTKKKPLTQAKKQEKLKLKRIFYVVFAFSILLVISYRNTQINESFSKIQSLKTELSEVQKANEQLNVNIQNSLNLNKIEQSAKDLLGMQKLTTKQTIYVSLPKRDYVEPATEEVVIEQEEKGFIESIKENIMNIFK